MSNGNDKAFDTMTAVTDKTEVDIKKQGQYADYAVKARGLRGGNVRPNYDESGERTGESTVKFQTEQNPKTGDWESFPTLFHDKEKWADEGGWKEYGKWGVDKEGKKSWDTDIKGAHGEAS